jgi:hypothetical protein
MIIFAATNMIRAFRACGFYRALNPLGHLVAHIYSEDYNIRIFKK